MQNIWSDQTQLKFTTWYMGAALVVFGIVWLNSWWNQLIECVNDIF
jgi:hypothetical protein